MREFLPFIDEKKKPNELKNSTRIDQLQLVEKKTEMALSQVVETN